MALSDASPTSLAGIGVSPGLVAGPVARMAPGIPEPEVAVLDAARDLDKECERIEAAAQTVKKGLELSAAQAKGEGRTLLETTAQMAADPTLTSSAQAMVRERKLVPERAVWEAAGTLSSMLESLGGYMAERTRDVADVRDRIVAVLTDDPIPGKGEILTAISNFWFGKLAHIMPNHFELRDHYLKDIEKLPNKQQLSRYLLLAESALGRRDYPTALENLNAAARIHPNLSRLARLQLRYAFDHGDAEDVLAKSEKLMKVGAINDFEAEQYQSWAYRRLLAEASDAAGLKTCLKRIPEALKADELCVAIAEKYERLGLYTEAVKWVRQYYPQNRRPELLEAFVESVRFFNERGQQKAIDLADSWLKDKPDDAPLLMYLGQLAYGRSLWGKAQSYLEASIALQPSIAARLMLARVLDETGQPQKAQNPGARPQNRRLRPGRSHRTPRQRHQLHCVGCRRPPAG